MTIVDVIDFICEHWPVASTWELDSFKNWISWTAEHGFLFETLDGDKLVGLAVARPVRSNELEDTKSFDENSNLIFLDLVIATDKRVQKSLVLAITKRFGPREQVAYRHKGKLTVRPYYTARRALLRI